MVKNGSDGLPSFHTHWLSSLPFKFSIVQFCIAGLIITSSIWLILSIEKKHHQETQLSLSQNLGLTIVAQLQQTTSKIEALAASLGSMGSTYAGSSDQLKKIVPALLNTDGQQFLIEGGGIWPEPGAFDATKHRNSYFWARDKHNKFELINGYNNTNGSGYHSELWYKPTRFYPKGTTYWSDAYIDPYTDETLITASVPMWLKHEFIGVSTIDLALSSLKAFFEKLALHQGYLFALDGNNNLLAHPAEFDELDTGKPSPYLSHPFSHFTQEQPAYISLQKEIEKIDALFIAKTDQGKNYDKTQLEALLQTVDPSKRARLSALINANAQGMSPNSERTSSFVLNNDPLLKQPVLVSVFHMPRTYWKIILVTPLGEVGNQEHAIAAKIGIFLLLSQLIALVILFIFQHRLFIKPISSMVQSLQQGNIAKLELSANQRQDEIGQLAKAFTSRNQQLEIAYASLDASNLALEQQLEMQKHAQEQLKAHKDQLNDLLNASQNLICIKNTEGFYSLVNDKFCEVLGIERDKIIGAKDRDLFPSHIAEIIASHDRIVINNESPQSFEQPIPTNQGEITYLITKYPIQDQEGQIIALGAMAFDVSSIKDINEKLTLRGEELSNQLIHREMQIQHLQMTLDKVEQSSISIDKHKEQSRRLQDIGIHNQRLMPQLIAELLRQQLVEHELIFTKLRSKGALNQAKLEQELTQLITQQTDKLRHLLYLVVPQSEQIRSVHIKQFIEHLLAVVEPQLDEHQIQCQLNCPDQMTLQISPWTLLILLYKLLLNTIEHAFGQAAMANDKQSANKLEITVVKYEQSLQIVIKDNGVGLSPLQLDELNQNIQSNNEGSLAELALWLRMEFNGELTVTSEAGQYTEVKCVMHLSEDTNAPS
ncbi:PAS domain-containing protein [Shewanella eurypsychrophilus]|uniref:histidine kinase n=1 Tax=Shewanella eurypsychrophilus TaxID=2593656 RepID=A0ABX6V7E0_9GAMM|nr:MULTISPECIES: PAS domain-containing protein [Shewanella]QFU22504.1 PAS domain-containing protein [Shewanella sp. YLB-09]QPG57791.1 PAS domain-containing protein [Shewanella eurypsychrophilus]